MKMHVIFLILLAFINSTFAKSPSVEQQKNVSLAIFQRLEKNIDQACKLGLKIECSAKKCLEEVNPKLCYEEVMSSMTFEDKTNENKVKCEMSGDIYICGMYCGMIDDKPTDFCKKLKNGINYISTEKHLELCRGGLIASCNEYCTQSLKDNLNSKTYSRDLLDCQLNARKK